jgi:hypothetical protein
VDGWTARHDRAATVAYHQRIAQGDADVCGRPLGRTFALQRSTAFPAKFLRFLGRLGAGADKEQEPFDRGPVGDGLRRCGRRFCFTRDAAKIGAEADGPHFSSRFSFSLTGQLPSARRRAPGRCSDGRFRHAVAAAAAEREFGCSP